MQAVPETDRLYRVPSGKWFFAGSPNGVECLHNTAATEQTKRYPNQIILSETRLFVQEFCKEGSFDSHCTMRTEFLTAETADTNAAIDHGKMVFHGDRLCWADVCAFFTTDALALLDLRVRRERASHQIITVFAEFTASKRAECGR